MKNPTGGDIPVMVEIDKNELDELRADLARYKKALGDAYPIIVAVHDALVGKGMAGAFNSSLIFEQSDPVVKWMDDGAAAIARAALRGEGEGE